MLASYAYPTRMAVPHKSDHRDHEDEAADQAGDKRLLNFLIIQRFLVFLFKAKSQS